MRRKIAALILAGMLAGCGSTEAETSSGAQTSADSAVAESQESDGAQTSETEENGGEGSASDDKEEGFTIPYPSYLAEAEGEALTLEKEPERVVCLSNAALQIMVRCDKRPVAVTTTSSGVEYPDWVSELPQIDTGMSEVDTESIIAMEPDLVIMGQHLKEDYGQLLADAGIPVYYTSEGPSTTYGEVKEAALAFGEAFGGAEEKAKIEAEFQAVEDRAKEYSDSHETKKMMILFSVSPVYQQTSEGYLGSMLSMLPFENLSDTLIDPASRTAELDMEKLVEMNPEVCFAISPMGATSEDVQAMFEAEFTANPQIWNNLDAVKNGAVIYLPSEYVTSKGIAIIDSMNKLMDMMEETLK